MGIVHNTINQTIPLQGIDYFAVYVNKLTGHLWKHLRSTVCKGTDTRVNINN